ncbi:MAG: hypothetical protein KA319_04240 [Ferruginibacter sp.]|nr:hypothetical protein [Ferruginibacter sp.]
MKHLKLFIAVLLTPVLLLAQVKQHSKFGKEDLKKMVGKWSGTVTMAKKFGDVAPTKMPASFEFTASGDSLLVKAITNNNEVEVVENYDIALDGDITEWSFENRLYDIKQIIRSPNKLIIKLIDPNEKAMIDDEYAEIKTTFTIGDNTLFINQEVKYFQTEMFFVRKKIELNRQQ